MSFRNAQPRIIVRLALIEKIMKDTKRKNHHLRIFSVAVLPIGILFAILYSGCVSRRVTVIPAELASQTKATVIQVTMRDGRVIHFENDIFRRATTESTRSGQFRISGFSKEDQKNIVIEDKDILDALVERNSLNFVSLFFAGLAVVLIVILLASPFGPVG
jgi:hypothetical protein